ncbi:MAG: uL15 family ribosomal protein, partial [Chloroflexota bacterium]|nr:uL15 family ribosomal protein [Chloroflexota bacterium]
AWFEGGQTPLHVRTPKLHGFKNRFRVAYAPLNLGRLAGAAAGTLITPDVLEHDGLIRDQKLPVKILGVGDAPSGVTVHAHAFSRTAVEKLRQAGSSMVRLTWPDNAPADDAEEPGDVTENATGMHAHEDGDAEPATADAEPEA